MTIQVQSNNAAADAAVNKPTETPAAAKTETTITAPEANATVQETAATSETAETTTEAVETETETPEGETPTETADDKTGKKKGGFQRRIDKLNSRVTEKEREIEYWKQQALKGASATTTEIPKVETTKTATEGKPNPEKFATHAEFVEALADWKTDQKLKERDDQARKAKIVSDQNEAVKSYNERAKAYSAKNPDFMEALEGVDDITVSPTVLVLIQASENGPELAHEMAKNREEWARICKLAPLAAAREIGKFESKLAAKAVETKSKETKTVSGAPAPIKTVGGGGTAAAPPKTLEEAAAVSYAEYKRIREAQLKDKRRRA